MTGVIEPTRRVRRLVVGRPMQTGQLEETLLPKTLALPIFASDPLSSVAYATSGGAYIVARENLGTLPSLVGAAALLTDYVLTVAVSISAGIFAITSFVPSVSGHKV